MGCPHRCVFCNQNAISGCRVFDEGEVPRLIERALATVPEGELPEIAFFGGSFTGIDRNLMERLLRMATGYVEAGRVSSIRLSTRPDFISAEILKILNCYPVQTVELGIQSMDDRVLLASRRGHTAAQTVQSCEMIREAGFDLVGQMMIGLPRSDAESEMETAEAICRMGAVAARIYPTVVFRGTELQRMAECGEYLPLSLEGAVERAANVLEIFSARDVGCLRIGLCATEELTSPEEVYAGPNHPALGELVWNEIYYRKIRTLCQRSGLAGGEAVLYVPRGTVSKAVGQKRRNLERLLRETGTRICGVHETGESDLSVEKSRRT